MALRLYNTLSQKVELFEPLDPPRVRMYTCGPTVYHYVHIGNLRTFVFQDLLRRVLRYFGYQLTHVMNITDVEDKIIARAREAGVSIQDYTREYEEAFLRDLDLLSIERPEIMPRATDHIREMLELIGQLGDKGLTYESGGSTYFRISRLPGYGKLARLDPDWTPGSRHEDDEYSKEDPRDFVLWKSRKPGEHSWDSELGPGRPGWHIECSAMSMKYLGPQFDIHCGGVDLIFPHHENEIAQSEGATGRPFVKYWLHAAHLIVDGEKMSKSRGNFYTLRDLLERGYQPAPIRYLLASVHYRRQLNFTMEGLGQAASAIQRVDDFLLRIRHSREDPDSTALEDRIQEARSDFEQALEDDLNTSEALGALFSLIREVNPIIDSGGLCPGDRERVLELFEDANRVLGVFRVEGDDLGDEDVRDLIDERNEARRQRDYARADRIREQLSARGIALEDTKEGTRWKRQRPV